MSFLRRFFAVCLLSLVVPAFAISAGLPAGVTADQLRMVEQLSPQDKAALAQQFGVANPGSAAQAAVNSPQTVQVRQVGAGAIETEVGDKTADATQQNQVVSTSIQADVPIEKATVKVSADAIELRRAFADFVSESKPMQVDASQLKQFGYDLFAGVPTTFAPATDVPVPLEYVLGPGDEISVQLFGQKNLSFTLVVDREGAVAFPDIGPLLLAGMSFSDAKAEIAKQVGDKMIGVSVSIAMGKLRSIRIFALGDVERPGSYVVNGLATLSHALFSSGGIKKIGSLRNVQLKRDGKVVTSIDLYDFLLKGDTSKDVRLLPGDVVFVPPIGATAGIAGEVMRPAIYELQGSVDVAAMVKMAGGYLPKAYRDEALLERINESGSKAVKSFSLHGKGLATKITNGDVIKVFSALDFEENPVLLVGNVKRPGKFSWKTGMTLSDLLRDESVLLPETFMDYGVIEREAKGNREPEIVRFDLNKVLSKEKGHAKLKLNPRDKVFVFHRSHFRQMPKTSIAGSIKTPGEYELKKNMRILDLVLAAGGVQRDTYMEAAELYRTDPKTKDVSVLRFNLAEVMAAEDTSNVILQDMDRVVVHSIWEKKYRQIVKIQGEVKKPGEFELGVGMRLSDLVFAAGGVTRDVLMGDVQIYRTNEQTKETALLVANLSEAMKGDEEQNVILQDLDRVVIHSIWEGKTKYQVRVVGEVNAPGSFTFVDGGMKLLDLIFAAGGLTEKALRGNAEITRYEVVDGEERVSTHFEVDLEKALLGDEYANVSLEPYDMLMVRQVGNWRQAESVSISGEVKYPGAYPVEDGERLSSLIERAGSFTEKAYLKAAVFTRESIKAQQQEQMDRMAAQIETEVSQQEIAIAGIRDASLFASKQKSLNSAKRVLEQMKQVKASGRLVIELRDIEALKDTDFDMTLRDGDRLHVPKKPDQVLVMGQVYNSVALVYQDGRDVDDYIEAAGGMTKMADDGSIYVVRANGQVDSMRGWASRSIHPGDAIIVPEDLETFYLLDSLLDWSKVSMQVGVGVASMKTIGVL